MDKEEWFLENSGGKYFSLKGKGSIIIEVDSSNYFLKRENQIFRQISENNLNLAYPNPFNPKTIISYKLVKESFVSLSIYDIMGRKITTLVNEMKKPGNYSKIWDASQYSAGIYFLNFKTQDYNSTQKLIFMK